MRHDRAARRENSREVLASDQRAIGTVGAALLLAMLTGGALVAPATAQPSLRIDGTVLWLSGQTLTLQSDLPPATWYQIIGPYLIPAPGPRPTVNVDLHQLAQSEYAFLRSGERIAVTGVVSSDRRRLVATSIIRDPDHQAP